ncbi:hypothetical protein ABKN59_009342 [Abortiporus biennis]
MYPLADVQMTWTTTKSNTSSIQAIDVASFAHSDGNQKIPSRTDASSTKLNDKYKLSATFTLHKSPIFEIAHAIDLFKIFYSL